MASFLSDLAKRPAKEKALIFAAIAGVCGGAYWYFGYKPAKAAKAEAAIALADEQAREGKLAKDAKERDELVSKSDELNREIEANQTALPTSAELPAFFDMLNRKVGEAAVEVKSWDYKSETKLGNYMQVPVEIQLTGTFHQIKRFFASLTPRKAAPGAAPVEQDRIISVEGLTLKDPKVKNREIVLSASFTVSTFRQEMTADPKAPAKPAAGKPGAPAPATPGKTGNPVADSKTKADAAMTKDQQRVDSAVGSGTAAGAEAGGAGSGDRLKGGL